MAPFSQILAGPMWARKSDRLASLDEKPTHANNAAALSARTGDGKYVTLIPPPTIPPFASSNGYAAAGSTSEGGSSSAVDAAANGRPSNHQSGAPSPVPTAATITTPKAQPPQPKGPTMKRTGGPPLSHMSLGAESHVNPASSNPFNGSSSAPTPRVASVPATTSSTPSSLTQELKLRPGPQSVTSHPGLEKLQRKWENPPRKVIPGVDANLKRKGGEPPMPAAKRQHISPNKPKPRPWGGDSRSYAAAEDDSDDDSTETDTDIPATMPERPKGAAPATAAAFDTSTEDEYRDDDQTDGTDSDDPDTEVEKAEDADAAAPLSMVKSDIIPELIDPADIDYSLDGRPYRCFPDANGRLQKAAGALLPTGYAEDKGHAQPWVCPVRDCRRRLERLTGLGSHFNASHNRRCLNDNLDGTFTVVGQRRSASRYSKKLPAVVVSQNRGDPEEPIAEAQPSVSSQRERFPSSSVRPEQSSAPPIPVSKPGRLSVAETEFNIRDAKQMIEGVARANGYTVPAGLYKNNPDLRALMRKKRLRNLDPGMRVRSESDFITEAMFKGFLVYMLGTEKARPCTNCERGHCFALSKGMRLPLTMAQRLGEECSKCLITTPRTPCSNALRSRSFMGLDAERVKGEDGAVDENVEQGGEVDMVDLSALETASRREEGTRHWSKEDLYGVPADIKTSAGGETERGSSSGDGHVRNLRRRQGTVDYRASQKPARTVNRHLAGAQSGLSTPSTSKVVMSAGIPTEPDLSKMMEMEEWEVAPGKIKSRAIATEEGQDDESGGADTVVAYSSTFLTNNKIVSVAPGVGFATHVLLPGQMVKFGADEDIVRVCQVHGGKVRVKSSTQGVDASVGPGGMIRVAPGREVVIANRVYANVVLGVTSVDILEK